MLCIISVCHIMYVLCGPYRYYVFCIAISQEDVASVGVVHGSLEVARCLAWNPYQVAIMMTAIHGNRNSQSVAVGCGIHVGTGIEHRD